MSSARKCRSCSTTHTRPCFLYVVSRSDEPWTKVGITVRIGNRLSNYRAAGEPAEVEFRQEFCCSWFAQQVEFEAHKRIFKQHSARRGDWSDASVDQSIAAVRAALKSKAVRQYR